jgi:Domain of unknown function (DUF4382)
MRRPQSFARAIAPPQSVFLAILLCCLGLIGCDNSCVVFVSNPGGGGGTLSGSLNSCSLNQVNGNVRLQIISPTAPPAGDTPVRIEHIFVTIRGIEANPNPTAADDSPDWQELAPKLLAQPVQVDLLTNTADSGAVQVFADAAVPANAYRQIRLRLSPNQSDETGSIVQENWCGSVGVNCVVTSEGNILPLVLKNGASQIQIASQQIVGKFFRVVPDSTVNLRIEFNPQPSLSIPMNGVMDDTVSFVPQFTVESQTVSESAAAVNK